MEQDLQNGMKLVNVSVNLGQMFVIINNVGININADVNVKKLVDQIIDECTETVEEVKLE